MKIVFTPRGSRIRPYKIAKALKHAGGYQLILVCEEPFYDADLFDGIFDEVHFYNKKNAWNTSKVHYHLSKRLNLDPGFKKMMAIINRIKPDVIHTFAEPYNHIKYTLQHTEIPVVITDGADFTGMSAGVENLDAAVRAEEQFCFENASGIVYKGPKYVGEYYRNQGYALQCPELSWFDHCDEELFVQPGEVPKLSATDGELHVVYSGNVSVKPSMKYVYYVPLAEELARQKIHFHVYPNPWQYRESKDYIDLDRNEKYFHWHQPVPLKQLIREVAQYDWGAWIHAEDPTLRTSPEKMKVGIGNKLFTYMEAGLPQMVSDSRIFGSQVAEEHGIGFALNDADWPRIGELIAQRNPEAIQQAVRNKRQELSLQNNSGKFAEFYTQVISHKANVV